MPPSPRFPIYIPSKSRAATATTPRVLDELGVPYRIIVETEQVDEYAEHFGYEKILTLDARFQDEYETCDELGDSKSKGPGPARNFAWAHALAGGAAWHWVMDDNIALFARMHENERIPVGDGACFAAMEDFTLRYANVAMSGPFYWMFAKSRDRLPPFVTNTRIYSCNLIRNDVPLRWRGRYNEDTDLSLSMLKAGWCTIQFYAFLQWKMPTQTLAGGNDEAFYAAEGTLPKSEMLARMHPDVARVTRRFGRWHHHVDYSGFKGRGLVLRADAEIPDASPYRFVKEDRS